ncbi:TetR/AcrR family transcriptional regulator [Frankia tisae]|uniref:TetR/AcrR family transcriptional regulator n=1 Tax=Frankia tisae TaxID=2950104 RepID=UPI0021BF40AE|nr:TetR/AcrR family transcriptional regulator [Frankia tisae]
MTTGGSSPSKPLRADAERNRSAILAAAARLLAKNGLSVSLDDVAAEAGVGSATIYRRFSSRDKLASDVLGQQMAEYVARTEADLARSQHDPWGALTSYTHFVVERQIADRAFAEVLSSPGLGTAALREDLDRTHRDLQAIVQNALDAKVVRPDMHCSDLLMLFRAVNGLIAADAEVAAEAWPRLVATFLAAWRSDGPPLPPVPAVWDQTEA